MKYFLMQEKRLIKMLPTVVLISALLLGAACAVFTQFSSLLKSEQESRFKIAVAGKTDGRLFQFGVTALQTIDSSRFSIDIEMTDEETAKKELLAGEISAYIVMPENFMKLAQMGTIVPISYYTTASTIDISALMRDEITEVVSAFLKESQKGIFGEESLLRVNGYPEAADEESTELAVRYINFIVSRDNMYQIEITGVSYGLDLTGHLAVGFSVIFLFILPIPFLCLLVRRDNSMLRLLSATGKGAAYSAFAECLALFATLMAAGVLLGVCLYAFAAYFDFTLPANLGKTLLAAIPILLMVSAVALAAAELCGNILSAVLGYFFVCMGLGYSSGCMYPLYALPDILRKIAAFTPTGASRAMLSLSLTGEDTAVSLLTVCGYTVVFWALTVAVRRHRLSRGEG